MAKKKKVAKKKSQKAPAKKQRLSPKEKKLLVVSQYLDEIFHLAGHSIEAGTEELTPLHEILMLTMQLHNEAERESGHTITELKVICECKEKEHIIPLRAFKDDCLH